MKVVVNTVKSNPGKSLAAGLMATCVLPLSSYGVDQYKAWEGEMLAAYADPATGGDPWTICAGATGNIYYDGKVDTVRKGLTLTTDQCRQVDQHIADAYRVGLSACVTRPLTQSQSDGLIIFAINIGVAGTCASSVVSNINAGKFDDAAAVMLRYSCAPSTNPKYPHAHCGPIKRQMPGLLSRRKFEAGLLTAKFNAVTRSTADNLAIANAKLLEDAK